MDTSGSASLVMLAVQSVSALALAAFVAAPSGPSGAVDAIATTRVAERPAVVYGTLADVCRGLDASPGHAARVRLPAGSSLQVLRVTAALCDGFTVPMYEVRARTLHGYVPAAAGGPLPLTAQDAD